MTEQKTKLRIRDLLIVQIASSPAGSGIVGFAGRNSNKFGKVVRIAHNDAASALRCDEPDRISVLAGEQIVVLPGIRPQDAVDDVQLMPKRDKIHP